MTYLRQTLYQQVRMQRGRSTAVVLLAFLIIVSVIALSCAGQVPPSGGPPDTVPPEIIETYPTPQTLRFNDNVLHFSFSEYVDRRSLEEAFFVSPPLGKLTFEWSGTEVEVQFSDSLRRNTTYIVTIGTDVKDTRNNNRMARSFSLAFSTGDLIDSGQIAGAVFGEKNVGITIFAYLHEGRMMDTLNPSFATPDYLTQTGKDGSFLLPYLRLGTYRLFAVRDEYKNLLYDQQTDEVAVPTSDVELSERTPFVSGIQFQLSREDTSSPFLSSVRSLHARLVLLRFSEPIDTSTLRLSNFQIFDSVSNQSLQCIDVAYTLPASNVFLVTAPQESLHVYRVELNGIRDTMGNRLLAPAQIPVFTTTILEDTSTPVVSVKSSAPSLNTLEPNDVVFIEFSEPVRQTAFENGWTLTDSSKQDVPCFFSWTNSMMMTLIPSQPLRYGMKYSLSIVLDSVRDVSGNCFTDSTQTFLLKTISESSLGSIEGNVISTSSVEGKIILTLKPIGRKDIRTYKRILNSPSEFVFQNIPEGKYTLGAFVDRDSNGVYSYGKPFPFHPSEYFTFYPDTLKIRARWPLEGVIVRLR